MKFDEVQIAALEQTFKWFEEDKMLATKQSKRIIALWKVTTTYPTVRSKSEAIRLAIEEPENVLGLK